MDSVRDDRAPVAGLTFGATSPGTPAPLGHAPAAIEVEKVLPAFAPSWGAMLVGIAGRGGVPGGGPMVYLAMLIGPPVAGLLLTGLVSPDRPAYATCARGSCGGVWARTGTWSRSWPRRSCRRRRA